jgi:transposase
VSQFTRYSVGMDTSDREVHLALLEPGGSVLQETTLPLDRGVLSIYFQTLKELDPIVTLETGTHSNWLYDLLKEVLGITTVIVADARQLKLISMSKKKTDRIDARKLARLAQTCPELLHSVQPRSEQARQDRRLLSARRIAVESRTKLIAHVRGIVKSTGARLATCDTSRFPDFEHSLPESLKDILAPLMNVIRSLNASVDTYDVMIKQRCETNPVIERLTQVKSVGPVTALAFVATVEDPMRFPRNRDVSSFLGLTPRIDDSGMIEKQLSITKAGDGYVRQLLVISAQGILRRSSAVTDLKRWGQSIAESGGKRGKRRAAVAVARKLAVLLVALWKTGADYQPLRKQHPPVVPLDGGTSTPRKAPRKRGSSPKANASLNKAA